ncbi:capsular polysaccharide export protein, LipB/KpsS family [Loktanella sp. S4079]|uniref:capsular polysaccharide export protein, LipB/KpsS family n=1 Tax=Loktanella sp. S4079 TaxID=579483 RepID=UPI0005F9DED4|nr:hypothetical protein [Loktanella sp. S4079]KJZ21244.1 hypothetical protein TW80_01005 [Loktanella sp. S4079]
MFHYVQTPEISRAPSALLLQGPVGPFFHELQLGLQSRGVAVRRVLFNAGDRAFADAKNCLHFAGSLDEWGLWLHRELERDRPDFIVLFGAMRPIHRIAKEIAVTHHVRVVCLEEGYLRSGYITCEDGGNNSASPLCTWAPDENCERPVPEAAKINASQFPLRLLSTIYYLQRDFRSEPDEELLFHRRREGVVQLSWSWAKHLVTRAFARYEAFTKIKRLKTSLSGKYILVPLQTPGDSQLRFAARGWSNEKLIKRTLRALKESGSDELAVFKMHPLDRKVARTRAYVLRTAEKLGMLDRVMIINAGAIGEITHHAAGVVLINSTSAFSALHHRVPILVLGDAIYRHDDLVTIGDTTSDIRQFMAQRRVKCKDTIEMFIRAVRVQALLPGDFYNAKGRKVAVDEISDKLVKSLSIEKIETGTF